MHLEQYQVCQFVNLVLSIHGRQAAMSHHYFPFRATTFDSSGQNYFFKWYLEPLKCDLKKSSRVTQKSTTQTIFSTLLMINIMCVDFLNCFTMKFLTNLTESNVIQLLTHYTKS